MKAPKANIYTYLSYMHVHSGEIFTFFMHCADGSIRQVELRVTDGGLPIVFVEPGHLPMVREFAD